MGAATDQRHNARQHKATERYQCGQPASCPGRMIEHPTCVPAYLWWTDGASLTDRVTDHEVQLTTRLHSPWYSPNKCCHARVRFRTDIHIVD